MYRVRYRDSRPEAERKLPARVIHIGVDVCYRLGVLRRAGYEIQECANLIEFRSALRSGIDAGAVFVNDSNGRVSPDAFSIARQSTSAPIILFPNSGRTYHIEQIDLIVPCFTPPDKWLRDVANLIVQSRALRACSQA